MDQQPNNQQPVNFQYNGYQQPYVQHNVKVIDGKNGVATALKTLGTTILIIATVVFLYVLVEAFQSPYAVAGSVIYVFLWYLAPLGLSLIFIGLGEIINKVTLTANINGKIMEILQRRG